MGHPWPPDSHVLLVFYLSPKGGLQTRLGNEGQSEGGGISSQWAGDMEAGGKNGEKAAPSPFIIYWLFFYLFMPQLLKKKN